jgi:hypothetical protein
MSFVELDNEQRRQLVDATQAFEAWRAADREFRHSYRGAMHWRTSKGKEYLGRKYGRNWEESLGARSPETERIKADYTEARTRLRQRVTRLAQRLDRMAPVNRALRLGRMPLTPARVLRKLDEAGLLGRQLVVVGTNCLYPYEARSGVLLDSTLTATTDIDLLIDARQRLSLAMAEEVHPEGVLGLLQKADRSFARVADYRAANDDGYFVDLIAPLQPDEVTAPVIRLGKTNDDLAAATIVGLQWLINAPKFDAVVIAEDGRPLWMSCIDPRAFALHKHWLAKRKDRDAVKRRRDAEQARAVTVIASEYLNLRFNAKDLTALPLTLVQGAKDLAGVAQRRASKGVP